MARIGDVLNPVRYGGLGALSILDKRESGEPMLSTKLASNGLSKWISYAVAAFPLSEDTSSSWRINSTILPDSRP